jgi:hypothetical protein
MYNSKYCDAQMFKALSLEAHMELYIIYQYVTL